MMIEKIPEIEQEDILFGSAECFWERYFNSYVLQIESKRHMTEDKISVNYQEALNIKKNRNESWIRLKKTILKKYKLDLWTIYSKIKAKNNLLPI